jgi:hypothetical protein
MFAEATRNQEEISVVGDLGKVEVLIPESVVRTGIRGQDRIGQVDEARAENGEIRHAGYHYGASYIEHLRFREAIVRGSEAEIGLDAGLWSVAVGVAAQRSIAEGRPIELEEIMAEENSEPNHG